MANILFISKYLSTRINGFESRLSVIINLFKKNKYTVSAITSSISLKKIKSRNQYFKKKIDNVDYFFIKEDSNYSNYSFKRILSWLNFELGVFKFNYKLLNYKPDIIYISSLSLFTILNGIYLKKKFRAKLVFEMRDFWPYFLIKSGKFSKYNPLIIILGLIEKYGIYHSDLIISLIPNIKSYLKYRGFFNKKSFSSTFPVNKNLFTKEINKTFNVNNSKFNICYAGNFGFDNYLDELLCLVASSKAQSFTFHFIGSGSQKNSLKKKYSFLKNCKFYDYVNYTDLHSILLKMDCLVVSFGFNSRYPIFGYELNKLNNYLMSEKPIIVIGSKKNILKSRGEFIFVTKNDPKIFDKKLYIIKNKYKHFTKIAKINKIKLLKRNNSNEIFKKTVKEINKL